jgi:hypothetical protein
MCFINNISPIIDKEKLQKTTKPIWTLYIILLIIGHQMVHKIKIIKNNDNETSNHKEKINVLSLKKRPPCLSNNYGYTHKYRFLNGVHSKNIS